MSFPTNLHAFIDRCAATLEQAGALSRVRLFHVDTRDCLQPVGAWDIDVEDESTLHRAKAEVARVAQDTASAWRGLQRFALRACYGPEWTEGSYCPFSLNMQDVDAPGAGPASTEGPTDTGMLKQQMRHNEALTRLLVGERDGQQQALMRQNQQMSHELERVREQLFTMLRTHEESITNAEERRLMRLEIERTQARRDAMASKAAELLPLIGHKVAGHLGMGTPAGAPPSTERELMRTLLQGLTDQTLEHWLKAFPDPTHRAMVMELYDELVRKPAAAAAAEAAAKNTEEGGEDVRH